MFHLRVLGRVELCEIGEEHQLLSILSQPKRVALLAYLLLAGPREAVPRSRLLGLFWPDSSESRARNALSQALHVLRRGLGPGVVLSEIDDSVAVDAEQIRCDALHFERLVDEERLEEALALYRGPFLDGLEGSGGVRFERWLELERRRYRELAVGACVTLAEADLAANDPSSALRWAREGVRHAPLADDAVRAAMRAHAALGDPTRALETFGSFEERHRSALAADPSEATRSLAEAIRAGRPLASESGPGRDAEDAAIPARRRTLRQRAGEPGVARRVSSPRAPGTIGSAAGLLAFVTTLLAVAGLYETATRWEAGPDAAGPGPSVTVRVENGSDRPELDPVADLAAGWVTERLGRLGLREPPGEAVVTVAATLDYRADSVRADAALLTGPAGDTVRTIAPIAVPDDDPLGAVHRLAERVSGALATVYDPRLASWSRHAGLPPTYEAYRAFIGALERFVAYDYRIAADSFTATSEAWPDFTLPRLWAARSLVWAGQRDAADSILSTLLPRRDKMPAFDRALLQLERARLRADWEESFRAASLLEALAPASEVGYWRAESALNVGRLREGIAILDTLDRERGWLRDWSAPAVLLAKARHWQGRHEEEMEVLSRAEDSWEASPLERWSRLHTLGALGELARGRQEIARLAATWPDEAPGSGYEMQLSRTFIYELEAHGHHAAADSFRAQMLDAARRTWAPSAPFPRGVVYAWELLWANRLEEVEAVVATLEPEHPRHHINLLALRGHLAARRGDEAGALAVVRRLAAEHGPGTRFAPLSFAFQAGIYALLGRDEQALTLLERAKPAYRDQYGFTPLTFFDWMHRSPRFRHFAGDERFETLLERSEARG